MNSRETILNKLNKLKNLNPNPVPDNISDNEIYSDYPDKKSFLDLFTKRFETLNGELHITENIQSASKKLENIIPWKT